MGATTSEEDDNDTDCSMIRIEPEELPVDNYESAPTGYILVTDQMINEVQ